MLQAVVMCRWLQALRMCVAHLDKDSDTLVGASLVSCIASNAMNFAVKPQVLDALMSVLKPMLEDVGGVW